ncbi:serine/threonine protein kinase [Mycoplasmopsis felis]|uniref:serine/threonine-protein kinase n=1 Tax=Mycoplasmopsis felis TaxID=33923 RepID=UPI003A4D59D6
MELDKNNILKNSEVYKNYEIIKNLGKGGMSYVFLIKNIKANKLYTLKYRNLDHNENNKTKFFDEIQILKELNIRNIPQIIEYVFNDNEQFFIFDYIEGISLSQYIHKNTNINIDLANHFMLQLLKIINNLHKNKIIHRDIKSQNILISKNYELHLIDFGISMHNGSKITSNTKINCSPYYAAPEYSNQEIVISPSLDIYALGILYFELLTGFLPFQGKNEIETILMHIENEFPNIKKINKEIPNSILYIINKATQKLPNNRYKNINEFYEDISNSLQIKNNDYRVSYDNKKIRSVSKLIWIIFTLILLLLIFLLTFIIIFKVKGII